MLNSTVIVYIFYALHSTLTKQHDLYIVFCLDVTPSDPPPHTTALTELEAMMTNMAHRTNVHCGADPSTPFERYTSKKNKRIF